MRFARLLPLGIAALAITGCGSSSRYTVSQVKQAFTRVGLHHPKVDAAPPGTILNYGKQPHVVSVTISRMKIPVVFSRTPAMRVRHLGNVMVWFNVVETRAVASALRSLAHEGPRG